MPNDWTARVWAEFRAGNLTRAWRDVLLTLRTYRGHGGLICPAHDTLAERAKCSARTVQRALQQARALGLVSWAERRVRAAWRWLRASNRYVLELPADPVQPGPRAPWPRRRTNGQSGCGGESEGIKKEAQEERGSVLAEMMREAARLPDLLERRRAVMAERLRAAWEGRLHKGTVVRV